MPFSQTQIQRLIKATFQKDVVEIIQKQKIEGKSVGFVPTMGALHAGHISLIERAKKESDFVVCSIYVNPSQFNDKSDLEKYPRTLAYDIELLVKAKCDLLYLPDDQSMYPNGVDKLKHFDLGLLDTILEGARRPGHFQGVANVVDRFLEIIDPDKLLMGQKDFQQVKVIDKLLNITNRNKVQLIMCPVEREKDGLALSSRNIRLNESHKLNAYKIYECLSWMKSLSKKQPLDWIKKEGLKKLSEIPNSNVEYLEICDSNDLNILSNLKVNEQAVILAVVNMGGVRLLDNILI